MIEFYNKWKEIKALRRENNDYAKTNVNVLVRQYDIGGGQRENEFLLNKNYNYN